MFKKYKLENETNKLVKFFSRGMKQKVNLSIIEIVNSDFIILDEPTLGLDIFSIIFFKETLLNLKKEGKTILITSHNTKFCEDLADNIYLIFNKNIKRLDYINGCSLEQLFITEIGRIEYEYWKLHPYRYTFIFTVSLFMYDNDQLYRTKKKKS